MEDFHAVSCISVECDAPTSSASTYLHVSENVYTICNHGAACMQVVGMAVAGKFTGGRQAVGKHMIAMECKEIRGGYNDLKKEERN